MLINNFKLKIRSQAGPLPAIFFNSFNIYSPLADNYNIFCSCHIRILHYSLYSVFKPGEHYPA